MPRGDKTKYSAKQKREARHIEEGYEKYGVSEKESERRAWATINKIYHGGVRKGAGGHHRKDSSSKSKSSHKKSKQSGY